MSILTRTRYQVICDCCGHHGLDGATEALARESAAGHGWQHADIGGRLADVCARCAAPGHDRAGCKP
jgi:hypothetical protein